MAALTQAQPPSTVVTEIPGRFSPTYVVDKREISLTALATPTAPTLVPSATGGTFPAGINWVYAVTAINAVGESLPSASSAAGTTTGAIGSIAISWTAVTGASGYRLYGRSGATANTFMIQLGNVLTYTDTYAVLPSNTPLPTVNYSGVASSSVTGSVLAFLPRVETIDSSFDTPTIVVAEVGTNFHVSEFDDLPEAKLKFTAYDVGSTVISLITGKDAPVGATMTYGFNDLNAAVVDVIRQFADPNGNVFASMYMGDMVIDEFSAVLKAKSAAMEDYSLVGFNLLKFKGFIQTKAYVVAAADVTATYLALGTIMGASEGPVALPVPLATAPPSYWIQRGAYNFLKIDRYRAGVGWKRIPEKTTTPTVGYAQFVVGTSRLNFFAGDLIAGDVVYLTYCTYATNVAGLATVPQTTLDTSEAAAVPTRLTPFSISGQNIPRGVGLDIKLMLKRERAEGVGDTDGQWGPSDPPELSVSFDVKATDFGLLAIMMTGSPNGTDAGGTVAGDFFDPNYMTRIQLNTVVPVVATINDPKNAGAVLKTYTCPTVFFSSFNDAAAVKGVVNRKFGGKDRVGNIAIAVIRP